MFRQIGKRVFKGTLLESAAFTAYEWVLDRYVAGSVSPSGYYTIEPESSDIPPFDMWLRGTGPSDRKQIRGQYELEVTSELISRIDTGTEFWEVGGGWGYHSLALAPLVGRVVAFEADRQRAEWITESAQRNGYDNVDVVHGTVGTDVSLDEYTPPDIVLLDVEGWELEVLEDSPRLLEASPVWIVEIHEPDVSGIEHGVSPESVYKVFERNGYEVRKLSWRKPGNFHIVAESQSEVS